MVVVMNPLVLPSLVLAAACTASLPADVLTVPGDHPSIEAAVLAAENGDEIRIGPGTWFENLYVGKRLTFVGAGQGQTIIDGSRPTLYAFGSCMVVTGIAADVPVVTIESLTLRNGAGSEIYGVVRGGGIYNEGSRVVLNEVTIEDCAVVPQNPTDTEGWGGAICSYLGDCEVNSSILRNNSSFTRGGAILCDFGDVVINDTLVTGNTAAFQGGAIFLGGNASSLQCRRSTVCDNQSAYGGALALFGFSGFELEDSAFTGNLAGDGAALYMEATVSSIAACSFEHNLPDPNGAVIRILDQPAFPDGESIEVSGSVFCDTDQGDWRSFISQPLPNQFAGTCGSPADLDRDGLVSGVDLSILLANWGPVGPGVRGDLDCDGLVSGEDLARLLADWS